MNLLKYKLFTHEMRVRKNYFLIFKYLMAFVYFLLGVVILSSHMFLLPVNHSVRTWFGILLVVYGLFRIYSLFVNLKRDETK